MGGDTNEAGQQRPPAHELRLLGRLFGHGPQASGSVHDRQQPAPEADHGARQTAAGEWLRPNASASTRACQLASTTFSWTPTVTQSRPSPPRVSTSTRVTAPVPCDPSRIRTL